MRHTLSPFGLPAWAAGWAWHMLACARCRHPIGECPQAQQDVTCPPPPPAAPATPGPMHPHPPSHRPHTYCHMQDPRQRRAANGQGQGAGGGRRRDNGADLVLTAIKNAQRAQVRDGPRLAEGRAGGRTGRSCPSPSHLEHCTRAYAPPRPLPQRCPCPHNWQCHGMSMCACASRMPATTHCCPPAGQPPAVPPPGGQGQQHARHPQSSRRARRRVL